MVKMKKMQNSNDSPEMDQPPDGSEDNKFYNQGVKPKVKINVNNKESKFPQTLENGSAVQKEKINGASCSSSLSSSSSSSSVNKMLNDGFEKNNSDHSSEKCCAKGRSLSSKDNDLKFHDKKRKTGTLMDLENSSGNEGDDGLSGDDCCVYTYKGDQFADLPNSLFSVGIGSHERNQSQRDNHRKANRRRQEPSDDRSNPSSSPEMDYLEMDFDPGPSLEQDSEDDIDAVDCKLFNGDSAPDLLCESVENKLGSCRHSFVKTETYQDSQEPQPGPSYCQTFSKLNKVSENNNCDNGRAINGLASNDCCSETFLNCSKNLEEKKLENFSSTSPSTCQRFGEERLEKCVEANDCCAFKQSESVLDSKLPFDGMMLWTEQEAISKQVSPDISCGATAVINAMLVLKMQFSIEKVKEAISVRLKSESASIPQYLVSRSFAGVAHENLIRGIHHASHGALYARFFQTYPRRNIVLTRWLSHWMKKGAVPIVTMNVQRDTLAEDSSLDTHHHQMIFGVNSKGIYLTDPLECLQEEELWCRLSSPSVLKIKRQEITSRWSPGTNLRPLMFQTDERWKQMNVLGQVVNIIRESPDPSSQGKFLTQYISIPASSGITLIIPRNSSGYEDLVSATDLPLLSNSD